MRIITRRRLAWALLMMVLPAAYAQHLDAAAPKRPNVLWICDDDHAPYVIGAYSNTIVRTPHLDRLAAAGMRFDRAYCNSPVCTASRQSFLTGRYPRTIGVTELKTPLPESETTLAELLKGAGYETAAIGKMHFNSQLKHGFDHRLDIADYNAALRARGRSPIDTRIPTLPKWKPFVDPASIWLNGFHRPIDAIDKDMEGTYFAAQAAEFLRTPRSNPYFLIVSFYEPHSPFRYPIEYRDRHDPARFTAPVPGPEDDDQIPTIFRGLTPADKQGILASYYTSVEFMDKNVGLVLDALEQSGQADDTLVIYTGDHGYMLGQHGRFEKHTSYEEAVRAGLLVRKPGLVPAHSATSALVEFIDVAPTVLDVCGVEIPAAIQGRSLLGLLTGKTDVHRDRVIVEYAPNDEIMIRDRDWKFVFERNRRRREDGYDSHRPLTGPRMKLFDLSADPAEMHNVSGQPEQKDRVAGYLRQLAEHLKKTARLPDHVPKSDNPLEIVDFCVQPRDVGTVSPPASP